MKTLKKLTALFLAVLFVLSPLAGVPFDFEFALPAEAASVSQLSYNINNGEVTITSISMYGTGSLTIPETIEGYPVTEIGYYAFYRSNISSVTIPNSVKTIGGGAFRQAFSLETITLGTGVTSIGYNAFDSSGIRTVNYKGTPEQWAAISIDSGNSRLTNATINFPEHFDHPACGLSCDHETPHEALASTKWTGGTMYNADYYLGSDITFSQSIIIKNNARLCLNGHTLTFAEGYGLRVQPGASLVLCDCKGTGGIARGTRVSNGDSSILTNFGTMTIFGGNYCLDGEGVSVHNNEKLYLYGGSFGIDISNSGTAVIYGGSYTSPLAYYAALVNSADATMTIYDCTVESEGPALRNLGTATIYGGTFRTTEKDTCIQNEGKMNIYDANITAVMGDGISNTYDSSSSTKGVLYFRGGTVTANSERGTAIYNIRNLYVYDGTLQGANGIVNTSNVSGTTNSISSCTISGGTISGNICGVRNSGRTWTSYTNGVGTKYYNKATLSISGKPSIGKLILEYPNALTFDYNGNTPIDLEINLEDFAIGEKLGNINSSKLSLLNLVMPGYLLKYSASENGLVLLTDQCGVEGSDLHWKLSDDGVLTIFGTGEMKQEYSGTRYPWGDRCNEIKKVVVEPGTTKIPAYAFEYCENLTTVTLPETLTDLNLQAFQDCGSLNNLRLPSSLTKVSGYMNNGYQLAILRCESLTDLYYLGTAEDFEVLLNGKNLTSNDSEMEIHFLQLYETAPTCTTPGVQAHYRFEDNSVYSDMYDINRNPIKKATILPALNHDYINHEAQTPTCIEIGWSAYVTCSRCDHTTYVEIPATGNHIYDNGCDTTCNECGFVRTTLHTPENGVCTECGKEVVAPVSAKLVLDKYIGVKYYFNKEDVNEDFTYLVTLPGRETPLAEGDFSDLTEEEGLYVLSFNGIGLSDFMTEFTLTGSSISDPKAEDYNSVYKLAKLGADHYADGGKEAELFKSIVDLGKVAAGGDAEFDLSYKAETPASSGKGAEEGANVRFTGKNLLMNDAIAIRLYGEADSIDAIENIKITLNKTSDITSLCDISSPVLDEKAGTYRFTVDIFFSASKMDSEKIITVTDGEGRICLELSDRVDWVAQKILSREPDNTLAKQVLIYIQAANEYHNKEA